MFIDVIRGLLSDTPAFLDNQVKRFVSLHIKKIVKDMIYSNFLVADFGSTFIRHVTLRMLLTRHQS